MQRPREHGAWVIWHPCFTCLRTPCSKRCFSWCRFHYPRRSQQRYERYGRTSKHCRSRTPLSCLLSWLRVFRRCPGLGKDEIITAVYNFNTGMGTDDHHGRHTAFYMFRLYYNIFWGKEYVVQDNHKPHESPLSMTFPLMFLALITLLADLFLRKFVSADHTAYTIHLDWKIAVTKCCCSCYWNFDCENALQERQQPPDQLAAKCPDFTRHHTINSTLMKRICSSPRNHFQRHISSVRLV